MSALPTSIDISEIDTLAQHGIRRAAVAVGCFDGVHRGHQRLLTELHELARATRAEPVAVTFHPHPREIICPLEPVMLLVSREQKLALLHEAGIRAVVTLPFTRDFAALSPEEFLGRSLTAPHVVLAGLCVGRQWRFGAGGAGNRETVEAYAHHHHFVFRAVPELTLAGKVVSSTAIRRAIASGLLDEAREMLGRPYGIIGRVTAGQHIAGPILACPTANLVVHHGIIPPAGVYAGHAVLADGRRLPAAIAIGAAPTFRHQLAERPVVEIHILDFTADLYGQLLAVEFFRYLREERCFSSPATLRAQIARDLAAVRHLLAVPPPGP